MVGGHHAISQACMMLMVFNMAHSQTLAPTASPTSNATAALLWYEGGYVGKVCSGTKVSECPMGQSCYAPTGLARAKLEGYSDVEDDDVLEFRCACWGYYGYNGHDNDSGHCEPTGSSYTIAAAYGIVGVCACVTAALYWYTVASIAMRWKLKRLKMNPAIVCLLLGAVGMLPMLFVAWGFATSPLALDPEASFERHGLKGYGIGGIALVGLPCLLNVVNLWIDVAMGAMNKGGTKTQRAATKKKVNCMVYTITAISSSLVIVLILFDLVQYVLAFLIVMAILMGCVYAYGGFMLSKALSQGMATDAESGGGCCKTSEAAKKDMNCYMVTMTANKIAYSMGGAVLGAVGYFVFPSRPNVPYLPEASVGPPVSIAFLLFSFNYAFFTVCLYIRYGLRKVLDLDFPDAPKAGATATSTTVDETPRTGQVAPEK